ALHEQGFTGKGVKMAIIDQPLGEHREYSSNIAEHNDVNATEVGWTKASMHGAAVTSIAVGETTGVAPDASVNYYSAVNLSTDPKDIEFYRANLLREIENNKDNASYVEFLQNELNNINPEFGVSSNQPYVDAINQILDQNEKLPENERVSVVSISWGFDRFAPGYEELQQALARAKEQGVFIVSTALEEHYGFSTCGANRNPQADPNNPKSYEAGAFWKGGNLEQIPADAKDELLLVPMDHRTVADFTDGNSYRYEGNDGGMSWSTPWLAGTYVLAKQANPNITPEEFWKVALETSDECRNNDDNAYVGRMINPQKIIETIR
ncbi:S8 family serine peptidase, partial [bacterium]|nr:S8 family serine peptidase [bacterium]